MLGLIVGGVVLSNAFRNAAEGSFDTRLAADMDGLIAAAEPDPNGGVVLQDRFVNHQFDRVYSGLYYQIKPLAGGPGGQISRSLFDQVLRVTGNVKRGAVSYGFAAGPENQHLRVLSRRVEFPVSATPEPGDSRAYAFMVAGDLATVDADSAAFNGTLIWSFALLGVGLVMAIFLQVRVGLLPLRRLKDALARIRDGSAQNLEGNFPAEIAPLAAELNSLIEHSNEVVGRARTHVSNLAHFLKTPLSVLASEAEAEPGPLADQVRRQVDTMRRQVDHYLTRARAAGSVNVLGNRTAVAPVLSDLARVLTRIHAETRHRHRLGLSPRSVFPGRTPGPGRDDGQSDGQCLQMGWHKGDGAALREGARFTLTVEDDGPGLSPRTGPRWEPGASAWTKAYPAPGWAWPSCGIFPSFMRAF